jgi:predicted MFS family arabinose efflux permease
LAACLIFALTLVLVTLLLRPDPQQIARMLDTIDPTRPEARFRESRPYRLIIRSPQVKLATTALIIGQLAMVVVMTMTPVHMHSHHHELGTISWVIMGHTMGMFGLSAVTGWLVERLGRLAIIMGGSLLLAVSCLVAPLNTGTAWLMASLFLLGLGWNFCFVAGSALLSDRLQAVEHGRVQGLTDSMINVVSGVGSIGGGLIFAAYGYTVISWITIAISLVPLVTIVLLRSALRPSPLRQPV